MLLPLSDASDSRLFELGSMVVSYGGRWKVKRWSKAVKVGYDFKVGLKNREMVDWKMIENDSKDKL